LGVTAAPDDKGAHEVRMKIYAARALDSGSTMAHGIFRAAAVESAAEAAITAPEDHRRFLGLREMEFRSQRVCEARISLSGGFLSIGNEL
jgi:hypothetical protein